MGLSDKFTSWINCFPGKWQVQFGFVVAEIGFRLILGTGAWYRHERNILFERFKPLVGIIALGAGGQQLTPN